MAKVKLNIEKCKDCRLCVEFCKKGAITMSEKTNSKGNNYPVVDDDKCVACGNCYKVCPDYVYEILE